MSSSNGLFPDIGLEVVPLSRTGSSVDDVETWASSDAGTSFDVDFAADGYCKIGLGASVPFWNILSKEVTLLSGTFEPKVFLFDIEDEGLSNDKDSGDSAEVPLGNALDRGGSSLTTFFVSFWVLLNGKPLVYGVCDAETVSAAALPFDTGRELGASIDIDLDVMFSFDTGFKLWPSFDLDESKQII